MLEFKLIHASKVDPIWVTLINIVEHTECVEMRYKVFNKCY